MTLFLIAQIAGRTVAIESAEVESVVDIAAVVPVPLADRRVCGLAALRSRVVTVIDTRVALGLPSAPGANRAVITLVEGHHYAILVDALEDVAPFELKPLSSGLVLDKGWRDIGRGIVERDDGTGRNGSEPILVVALDALVPSAQPLAA